MACSASLTPPREHRLHLGVAADRTGPGKHDTHRHVQVHPVRSRLKEGQSQALSRAARPAGPTHCLRPPRMCGYLFSDDRAAARNRSGSGFVRCTWSRVTTGTWGPILSTCRVCRTESLPPLVAIAQGTSALVRKASKSLTPGRGRTWAACRANASAWHRWSCSACSVLTGFPVSRNSALARSPPLIPTRR